MRSVGDRRRASPTQPAGSCPSPAPSTARSPWTTSPAVRPGPRLPSRPAARSCASLVRRRADTGPPQRCGHDRRHAPRHAAAAGPDGGIRDAIALLLDAVEHRRTDRRVDPAAPLVVIGGGAKGRTWVEVVRRLSGRPVLIPDAPGARGDRRRGAGRGHPSRRGPGCGRDPLGHEGRHALLDVVPRDDERLERIGALRTAIMETPALAGTAPVIRLADPPAQRSIRNAAGGSPRCQQPGET